MSPFGGENTTVTVYGVDSSDLDENGIPFMAAGANNVLDGSLECNLLYAYGIMSGKPIYASESYRKLVKGKTAAINFLVDSNSEVVVPYISEEGYEAVYTSSNGDGTLIVKNGVNSISKSYVTVTKDGYETLSSDDFYVIRADVYDGLSEKTEESVAKNCGVQVRDSDWVSSTTGYIYAYAVIFENGTPNLAPFVVKISNYEEGDNIINGNVIAADTEVTRLSNEASTISANIASLKSEIEAAMKVAETDEEKAKLKSEADKLDTYANKLEGLSNEIVKIQAAVDNNKKDISKATISFNKVKILKDGTPSVEFDVVYGGKTLKSGTDYAYDPQKDMSVNRKNELIIGGMVKVTGTGEYKNTAQAVWSEDNGDIDHSDKTMVVDVDKFMDVDTKGIYDDAGESTGLYLSDNVGDIRNALNANKVREKAKEEGIDPGSETVYAKITANPASQDDISKVKDFLKAQANNAHYVIAGDPVDISVVAMNADGDETKIDELGNALTFYMDLPDGKGSVKVARIHNDTVTFLDDSDVTKQGGKVYFKADKFSTYVIVYETTDGTYNASIPYEETSYTGSAIKPVVTVIYTPSGGGPAETLVETTDYTVTYSNNVNPGMAHVIVTGTGTYADFPAAGFDLAFAIKGTVPSGDVTKVSSMISGASSYTYTGSAIQPTVLVYDDGALLTKGTHYTVTYQDNVDAGTGTAIVQGIGSYATYRSELGFTIWPKDIGTSGVSISDIDDQEIEDGETATVKPKIKYNGMTLKKGSDYTLSYSDNKKSGTATVTIDGQGNYTGTVEEDFKVKVKSKSSSSSSSSSSMANSSSMAGTPLIQPTVDARSAGNGAVAGNSKSPQTGDTTFPFALAGLALIAIACVVIAVGEFKANKSKGH